MKRFVIPCIAIIGMLGCNNDQASSNRQTAAAIVTYKAEYDSAVSTLLGASFREAIVLTKTLYLSDSIKPDSFFMVVEAGPVRSSRTILFARTPSGLVLYRDTFLTRTVCESLFYDAEMYESSPVTDSNISAKRAALHKIDRGIIEATVRANIDTMFSYVKEATWTEVWSCANDNDQLTTPEFLRAQSTLPHKFVYIPCYSCYEGANYYACFSPDSPAIAIVGHD
jgi:hypothetical protein